MRADIMPCFENNWVLVASYYGPINHSWWPKSGNQGDCIVQWLPMLSIILILPMMVFKFQNLVIPIRCCGFSLVHSFSHSADFLNLFGNSSPSIAILEKIDITILVEKSYKVARTSLAGEINKNGALAHDYGGEGVRGGFIFATSTHDFGQSVITNGLSSGFNGNLTTWMVGIRITCGKTASRSCWWSSWRLGRWSRCRSWWFGSWSRCWSWWFGSRWSRCRSRWFCCSRSRCRSGCRWFGCCWCRGWCIICIGRGYHSHGGKCGNGRIHKATAS
mmetsp:Transcript_12255/g.29196  ORF Transcript_12255/g.29196 Transcript_12255/m.29196 type:complete len:275 (+) Transcript_12255:57-881(+)